MNWRVQGGRIKVRSKALGCTGCKEKSDGARARRCEVRNRRVHAKDSVENSTMPPLPFWGARAGLGGFVLGTPGSLLPASSCMLTPRGGSTGGRALRARRLLYRAASGSGGRAAALKAWGVATAARTLPAHGSVHRSIARESQAAPGNCLRCTVVFCN